MYPLHFSPFCFHLKDIALKESSKPRRPRGSPTSSRTGYLIINSPTVFEYNNSTLTDAAPCESSNNQESNVQSVRGLIDRSNVFVFHVKTLHFHVPIGKENLSGGLHLSSVDSSGNTTLVSLNGVHYSSNPRSKVRDVLRIQTENGNKHRPLILLQVLNDVDLMMNENHQRRTRLSCCIQLQDTLHTKSTTPNSHHPHLDRFKAPKHVSTRAACVLLLSVQVFFVIQLCSQ